MPRKTGTWKAAFWGLCLLMMILDSKTVLSAAAEGIDLSIRILIPSIFPFLVVCTMASASLPGFRFLRPVGRLQRLPEGAEDLFFLGLLGGYPLGAAMVSQAAKDRRISRSDGNRLLAFCSNAGPAFIFGIGSGLFPGFVYCLAIWAIHILSAFLVGLMTPGKAARSTQRNPSDLTMSQALRNAIMTMATICGWVTLMRIVIHLFERWVLCFLPETAQILLRGILELANGSVALGGIDNVGLRMILFSAFLSFGGICVWLQTLSVTQNLSPRCYLPGKLTQCAISILLASLAQPFLPKVQRYLLHPILLGLCGVICVSYIAIPRKLQNNSRNSPLTCV